MNVTACAPTRPYHNGSTKDPRNYKDGRRKPIPVHERDVIAWDMEGMNLSGDDKPQHPVLFGSSQVAPLVGRNLTTEAMLNHICDVAAENRQAIHVGYHFRYDANMLVRHLSKRSILQLWKHNLVRFVMSGKAWTVQYFPGKKFVVTRAKTFKRNFHDPDRVTATIYDYSSFFGGGAFLTTCEDILKEELTEHDRATISHGKQARGANTWDDIGEVRHYWEREIDLIKRVFVKFRDIMCQAGFNLQHWYGPGALANYLNSVHGMAEHIQGAQFVSGLMPDEVHQASKIAFAGGRFEAFQLGYVKGPIHAIDINSAYPYALSQIPSLSPEHGRWRHVDRPTRIERFGLYRVEYHAPDPRFDEFRPMPLFHRDKRGLVSFPSSVHGWYASPEASIVQNMEGVTIHEGWYWDTDLQVWPWNFLPEMYERRQRLGKENLLSIPFKLGPNSLYGKYAQTVGWDEDKKAPPKWHALVIAAWTTSMCRAMLWNVMQQAPDQVVAVETDSVYMTADPADLNVKVGDQLGEWSHKIYDAIIYLQSGMYLTQKEGEWRGVRSRGITRGELEADSVVSYVRGLRGGDEWPPLTVTTKPRFVGMGAALSGDWERWRTWERQVKEITIGDSGKRRHHRSICRACDDGVNPIDGPHRAFIATLQDGDITSQPRTLPWEQEQPAEVAEIRERITTEREMINHGESVPV